MARHLSVVVFLTVAILVIGCSKAPGRELTAKPLPTYTPYPTYTLVASPEIPPTYTPCNTAEPLAAYTRYDTPGA